MITLILLITLVSLPLIDFLAIQQLPRKNRRLLKTLYWGTSAVIYLLLAVSCCTIKWGGDALRISLAVFILWSIWLFIAQLMLKVAFLLFNVLLQAARRIHGRPMRGVALTFVALWGMILGMLLYGAFIGRNWVRVSRVEITSPQISPAFDGYRIAFISDLHVGNFGGHDGLLRRVSDTIRALDVDLLLFGGDLIDRSSEELTPNLRRVLSTFTAHDRIIGVIGNHDLGYYISPNARFGATESVTKFEQFFRESGWQLLRNDREIVRRGADSIVISGVDYTHGSGHSGQRQHKIPTQTYANYTTAYRGIAPEAFNITLAHSPSEWEQIRDLGIGDLTLAGHVHAMQFKIGQLSPARILYKHWSGLYHEGSQWLYVNDGIGYVMFPMRIGARPEVTLITLKHSS